MDEGGGYSRIGPDVRPRVRLYRSAAMSAGAGTPADVAWDAASAWCQKLGYAHDAGSDPERVVVLIPGLHRVAATVRFDAALLVSQLTVEIQADAGGGFVQLASSTAPAGGTALIVSGVASVRVEAVAELAYGAVLRVRAASVGAAAPLVVGDGATWFEATATPDR